MSIDRLIDYQPLVIAPDTLLVDAIAMITERERKNLSCCLLVGETELQGIVTKSDLIRAISQEFELPNSTVAQIMTSPVISLEISQCRDVGSVWSLLQQHSINYLPILGDNSAIIGVISIKSLFPALNSQNQAPESDSSVDREEKELERLFELTPTMLCIAGFDGYFKRINPVFSEILGFASEELFAEPFLNFVHPEDRPATIKEVENLTAGNTIISFENRYRTKNGDYRWLLWTAKPYLKEKLIYAAARDISERKEMELSLKESEERWQLALRGANDGIWDWNVRTNEVFFSRRWKEMLGFTEEEIGNNVEEWSKRVHPDDLDWVMQVIQDHFAKKTPFYTSEHRVLCKDGSYKWILDRGQALWDETGNAIRMAGSHTDITERRQAEQQRQQERDFSNAVIDTVGALIAVLDVEGKIIRFNHTCEAITGYSCQEVRNRAIWDILIAPEEKATVRAVFQQLISGQVPNQYTNYWLGKDGTRHLISWSNTALFDEEGKINFLIATGIDITEQRRVWNKLEHQHRQTKLLADVIRKIRMSIDLREILQTAVTEVQHLLTCDRVLIVQIRPNNTALPISEAVLPDLPPMLGYELVDPLLVGEYLHKYRRGEILAINDLATSTIRKEIKQLLQQFQIQAKLVVPILSQRELKALLVAHQCYSPRNWQAKEISLLNQLADQIGIALSQAQLLNNLESMIAERTMELTTANELLKEEIAERERTAAALRENQQKLEGILDNADEAIISIDERQNIQLFSQGAEKIFGYQAREMRGKPLDILLPEAFRRIHHQHITDFQRSNAQSRTMAERSSHVFGLRKNGVQFPAEASIAKLPTLQGIWFTVMLKDITERQEAQEKIQASQNLLAKAENIARIGSWEYNLSDRALSWSQELYTIFDFPADLPIPSCKEVLDRVHPEDRFLVINTLQKGHQEGEPWHFNYRLLFPDRTVKYLETKGEATPNDKGEIRKIWGTVMDITQRVRAEQSLQRSEQQLKLITDGLPVLIAYVDRQQRYLYNNRTYETWFGKTRSTLLGMKIEQLFSSEDYQKMRPYIETVLSGKTVSFEIQSIKKSGQSCWLNATYIPDFAPDREVKGFFSTIYDITERKEMAKMKDEFVSIASHEMRTPLTAIHGVIRLLSAGHLGELSPKGQEMVAIARKNSDRLVNLINDILDVERLSAGQDTITKQKCQSQEIIQSALETFAAIAKKQQITLENQVANLEFWADRDRIIQTLINLIDNAIKFSSYGSKVVLSCQKEGENILFSVKDWGRGIPQDKLETIFERFQQVDASDSREKGGTGLGLAICRQIVEQHQGKIWAESVCGEGSTFWFTIPQQ